MTHADEQAGGAGPGAGASPADGTGAPDTIRVVAGQPDDAELAAVVVALLALAPDRSEPGVGTPRPASWSEVGYQSPSSWTPPPPGQ